MTTHTDRTRTDQARRQSVERRAIRAAKYRPATLPTLLVLSTTTSLPVVTR